MTMSSIKFNKRFGGKKQLGQGMTEYIIIVALVAIAAIGVYSAFVRTLQDEVAQITNGVAGDTPGRRKPAWRPPTRARKWVWTPTGRMSRTSNPSPSPCDQSGGRLAAALFL